MHSTAEPYSNQQQRKDRRAAFRGERFCLVSLYLDWLQSSVTKYLFFIILGSVVRIVKTLIIKYGIYANIFAEKKNVSSICKSYSHFFSKNTCELDIVLTRTINILTTNELVKLTTLWTTGPCLIIHEKKTKPVYHLPNEEYKQELGSRAKGSWVSCTSECSKSDKRKVPCNLFVHDRLYPLCVIQNWLQTTFWNIFYYFSKRRKLNRSWDSFILS